MLNENRRPIGYLDIKLIKQKFEQGRADPVSPSNLPCQTTDLSSPHMSVHQNDPIRKPAKKAPKRPNL